MAMIAAAMLAAWIVIAFARQVAEASDACDARSGHRERQRDAAASRWRRWSASSSRSVASASSSRRPGRTASAGSHEIAFTLAPDAPPLAANAPGSAAVRLGAEVEDVSPLERWLTVLFGPSG